jgi:opacity protein-like surface antigen
MHDGTTRLIRARLAAWRAVLAGAVAALLVAAPAPAAADQVINLYGGFFTVRGEDGRASGDTINRNLNVFLFDVQDFNGGAFGGDWYFGIGERLEAGVGVGFYQRTVPSVYRGLVDVGGREIEQDFRLRNVPVTFTARLFPTGRTARVQPYIGGGLGINAWRYSETGEFVDVRDNTIFRDTYRDSGNALGPVVMGGLRVPVSTNLLVGGEVRYQQARADLDPAVGFLGDRLDLGGLNWLFTVQFGFN